jgi:predicted RNase H-like HicB family nuclease
MRFAVVIEKGEHNYSAYVPELPGCIATGDTRDEVLRNIEEAIGYHVELMNELGYPVPGESTEGHTVEPPVAT